MYYKLCYSKPILQIFSFKMFIYLYIGINIKKKILEKQLWRHLVRYPILLFKHLSSILTDFNSYINFSKQLI